MKKILLIEDNDSMRENIAEILELAHYKVVTAPNGKLGVELAMNENPDLIVCDVMMPVLDGYGVLHLLSKDKSTAGIPFIFLTAKAERSEIRKGMEMGADDYVTKPFEDIELLNAIEIRLKKSDLVRKEFSKDLNGLSDFISSARSLEDLKKLSEQRDARYYKAKEEIYREDSYPKGIYFVSKGKVKTFKTHELGKELITGLYGEGDFLGYLALLEEGKYTDSAEAIENAEVYLLPKEDFYSLIYKNAEVSRKFIKMLASNLEERETQLLKQAYSSVRKRIAEALVNLSNRYKDKSESTFSMNLSREDLANLAGTATETTIRVLSDFKEEKLIDIKGRNISILNLEKLINMRN